MDDTRHDTTDVSHDTTSTTVDVPEAAAILGISEDAVRARIRRGKLHGVKIGAVWRVHLEVGDQGDYIPLSPTDTTAGRATRHDNATGATPGGDDNVMSTSVDTTLVEHLQGEVEYLRAELAKRSDELAKERERSDILQREALERIEALTATITTSGQLSTDQVAEAPEPDDTDTDTQTASGGDGHLRTPVEGVPPQVFSAEAERRARADLVSGDIIVPTFEKRKPTPEERQYRARQWWQRWMHRLMGRSDADS